MTEAEYIQAAAKHNEFCAAGVKWTEAPNGRAFCNEVVYARDNQGNDLVVLYPYYAGRAHEVLCERRDGKQVAYQTQQLVALIGHDQYGRHMDRMRAAFDKFGGGPNGTDVTLMVAEGGAA